MPRRVQIQLMDQSNSGNLAAGGEEGLEEGSGLGGEHGWGDLDLVVELRAGEQLEAGAEGAAFRVVSAIDKAGDAGLNNGTGAHGAGLEGDVESGFRDTVVAELFRGFAENHDFGVRCGVAIANGAVAAACENFLAINKYRADGNFAGFGTGACFFQRDLHEFRIVHRGVVENITLVPPLNGLPSLLGSTRGENP